MGALKECLLPERDWPIFYSGVLIEMAFTIDTEGSVDYLLDRLRGGNLTTAQAATVAERIAQCGIDDARGRLVTKIIESRHSAEFPELILGLGRGLRARGVWLSDSAGEKLLSAVLQELSGELERRPPLHTANSERVLNLIRSLEAIPAAISPEIKPKNVSALVFRLERHIEDKENTAELRTAAAAVLSWATNRESTFGDVSLSDPRATPEMRERILSVLATSRDHRARLNARDAIKDAPYRTAHAVGLAMASTLGGAEDLLEAVKTGKAPARLLQEKPILQRLRKHDLIDFEKQVAALTRGLPAADPRLAELVKKRGAAFASAKPDKEAGAKVYEKHCAVCHKIGERSKIAPQLDGIGLRGAGRLLEDVLDPNRIVEQGFRARVITTKDEKNLIALMLRVQNNALVVIDGEGKERRIPIDDITNNRDTMLSPMPANYGDTIPEADLANLLAYLLELKTPPKQE